MSMSPPRPVGPDTYVLPAWVPLPGMGGVTVNAFFVRAAEPVLIDAGVTALSEPFLEQLCTLVDPRDLRWLWLTHADPDHVGAVDALLREAPELRIVTTYLGLGKLGLSRAVPLDRVCLLNPGQALDVGDRRLLAYRPPIFDAPETTMALDERTNTLFSADAFGALLDAPAADAADLPGDALRDGMIRWATVDAPWLHHIPADTLSEHLHAVGRLAPDRVMSAHLPPARDMLPTLLDHVASARTAEPFVGPDQAALMAMLGATV